GAEPRPGSTPAAGDLPVADRGLHGAVRGDQRLGRAQGHQAGTGGAGSGALGVGDLPGRPPGRLRPGDGADPGAGGRDQGRQRRAEGQRHPARSGRVALLPDLRRDLDLRRPRLRLADRAAADPRRAGRGRRERDRGVPRRRDRGVPRHHRALPRRGAADRRGVVGVV
ncbi:MAG: hypothetical protein AVDCRST_MAG73-133, partial [uncultured Thermomicrobiales bacterium]